MKAPVVLLAAAHELPPGDGWLSPSERAALPRLRAPKRRRDFRLGRFAAKRALALLWGDEEASDLRRFEVRPAVGGAPLAFRDGAPAGAAVSISHSHGWAAAAVHRGIDPLGCDLERVEARSAAFREDYFTAREQAFVAAAPADEAPLRATLVWSAKEAVMKALGQGLRLPPAAVRVLPSPLPACGAGWRSFSVLAPFAAVTLRGSWRVVGGFVLTVAGGRDDPRLAGAMLDAERRADPTSCLAPVPWP